MIKLIVFDFDDTIINNDKVDYQSFKIPFKQLGILTPSSNEIKSLRRKGLLAKEIAYNYLMKTKKIALIEEFFFLRKKFLQSKKSLSFFYLKNNIKPLFNQLNRKKINCVLCSARDNKKFVMIFLKKNKILKYFSHIYLIEDLEMKIENSISDNRTLIKKFLLNKIIEDLKIKSNEILFIGNSQEDIAVAKELQINFIYYQNSYLEKLQDKKIDKVNSVSDLKRKINSYLIN